MTLLVDSEWPVALPLPSVDYGGQSVIGTLVSPANTIASLSRSRFERTYQTLSVGWTLTQAQYAAFKSFFEDELNLGGAQFKIELRYPKNTELTEWAVVFVGAIEATHDDGLWKIQVTLQLVNPIEF